MRRLVAITVIASAAGCSNPTLPGPNLDVRSLPATISLKVGEQSRISGIGAQFLEVKGDSRCPVDVVCGWAGDAEVVLGVGPLAGDGPTRQISLHTTLDPHTDVAQGLVFTLVGLEPAPRTTDTNREYRAQIRVERQQ